MNSVMAQPQIQESIPPGSVWRMMATGMNLEVRLTRDPDDVAEAQALRYHVFYEEMSAQPTPAMAAAKRDFDDFDADCDHLLVLDHSQPPGQNVVGTYRLLPQRVAERRGGFYSSSEYDLSAFVPMFAAGGGLLELGRSCVRAEYRTTATIQLLWRAITQYLADRNVTHMFGCASLPGTDPQKLALPLSYLHHHHLAPAEFRVRALPGRYVNMNMLPPEQISLRRALVQLPPLVKGYLRLGCYVGEGAVVDHQFGTTDVFILLPVGRIAGRYLSHFEREDAMVALA